MSTKSVAFIFVAEMLIYLTSCNTVDQLLSQLRNVSSTLDLQDIQLYVEEFEQRYLLNDEGQVRHQESFWLYTRENRDSRQILKIDDPFSILNSYFSSERKTVVLVHGWLNAGSCSFLQDIKNVYLDQHDYNIICVDWSDMASNLIYPLARFGITYIGSQVFTMLATIVRVTGYGWEDFHLVGHSLGAHVCGITGENVRHDKIGRITGLDPALPLFSSDPVGRLDPTDAAFVDIIHTCAGYLGYSQPCGHVDFYPNGGTYRQPGCGFDLGTCSHTRSLQYFAESIVTKTGFYSRQCDSWENYEAACCNLTLRISDAGTPNSGTAVQDLILMGEYVNKSSRGIYFLMTASSEPYALGRYCPPKTGDDPSDGSSQLSKNWFNSWRDYLNSSIAAKVKAFEVSWSLLANNVYSIFS